MEYYSAKSSSQNGNHETKLLFPFLIIKLYALLCPLGLISLTAVSDKKCVHEKKPIHSVLLYILTEPHNGNRSRYIVLLLEGLVP